MYDQRIAEPAAEPRTGRAWRPDGVPFGRDEPDTATDRYIAVDRLDDNVATLDVAPWPTVDPSTGRLRFEPADDRAELTVSAVTLRRRVDRDRRRHRQLRRPIRVGDVFWVRGFVDRVQDWERVIDATRAGRFAAKAALLATAAGAPSVDASAAFGLDEAEPVDPQPRPAPRDLEEPPPPGPVAFPAV
jgi:hypothetical protein